MCQDILSKIVSWNIWLPYQEDSVANVFIVFSEVFSDTCWVSKDTKI